MTRKFLHIVVVVLIFCSPAGCATPSEEVRTEYGHLKSAVEASAYAVIGVYGENIPSDFDSAKFMQVVRGKISDRDYSALERYAITVQPKGTYYLLIVSSPDKKAMILFDFSCTPEADGLVYLYPGKYDTNNLDQYDPCKAIRKSTDSISGTGSK